MDDLISRQAAIDAIYHHLPNKTMDECRAMLHDVPSAQPEPKTSDSGSIDSEKPETKTDRTTDGLISRAAAIDAVKVFQHGAAEWREEQEADSYIWQRADSAIASAIEIGLRIKAIPSAQPEQRWVSCSERLPVQNGVYVVTRTISDGFEYGNITDCCYFDGTNTWHDDTRVNHGRKYLADVIAWQPLPESYREGEE